MAQAAPKQLRLIRKPAAILASTVRWLARKEIKAQWKRIGRQITYVDEAELSDAVTAHLVVHRTRLRAEAQLILSSDETVQHS
jgi:hypothetical protein